MTQSQLIKKHLTDGKTITPMEALRLYGCFRLGARIYELRNELNIHKTMVKAGTKYFAEYRLM